MRRSAAIFMLVGLAGCATSPSGGPGAVSRDGEQFGVVDGTFRGRWWNHYERGRSYLDGGFQTEAAADFQTALALRAEDQRWARTYGLHFIPEYFPNRELGIVRYNEGQLEEAERLLEHSLANERTALAAHYLDLVRAKQVSDAGGDKISPEIVASVFDEGTQATYHLEVKDNTYVARVVVNGNPLPLAQATPSATFTIPFSYKPGINQFDVYVTDIAGNTARVLNKLLQDLDGPAVSFDGVTGGSISGVIYDVSNLEEFSVDGRRIPIAAVEEHTWRFTGAAQGGEAFRAVDKDGNVTVGRVPRADESRAGLTRRVQLAANGLPQLAQDAAPGAGVRLTNLAPGQRYLMDEIVVAIEASDPDGIASITLDDVPLSGIVPGATMQFLSRRIRLENLGPHAVTAKVVDAKGEASETAVEIERAPTDVERPEERLRVALLGNLWEGAGPKLRTSRISSRRNSRARCSSAGVWTWSRAMRCRACWKSRSCGRFSARAISRRASARSFPPMCSWSARCVARATRWKLCFRR
jgi:hypothetical protein